MKKLFALICLCMVAALHTNAQTKSLHQLQQEFVDLRCGMFIHFNMPTFFNEDWPDPDASPELFNPKKMDCKQWAKAAKSANMTYGCLTTKHHGGFCIWDTKTTDYSVMSSPFKRDVVKEYADAFRAEGLEVMLYYSILDTHARLRPNCITPKHIEMIKGQLRELLTNYGEIKAIIIDGWDAPWSRISYDDVPFEDIYRLIKSIQPNCLVMDLNAAKYPTEALFYTDIKSYEQGAGQYCNFILNVAPNRDGLFDANALKALKEIGKLWKNDGYVADVPACDAPIIASNIAKYRPAEGAWSSDYAIFDFANDDDFGTCWNCNDNVKNPWYSVTLEREKPFNMIVITDRNNDRLQEYSLEYRTGNTWKTLFEGKAPTSQRVKIHRFDTVWGDAVRMKVQKSNGTASIAEFGIYCERK